MASILPNGKSQFIDVNGRPLVGGKVYFFEPNTEVKKDTWQDAEQTVLNSNPIVLDGAGQAVIYGNGVYRQVVYDRKGQLIWDEPVASSVSSDILSGTNGSSMIGLPDGSTLQDALKLHLDRVVDSIASLRAVPHSIFTRAFVTGYYSPHDGGGGAYQYDPDDTASLDNGGTVIVANDGGRWKLQTTSGAVSVEQFGVVDDPNGAKVGANSAAYNNAIKGTSGLFKLLHPEHVTAVVDALTISVPLDLQLDGTLKLAPNQNLNAVTLASDDITISGHGTIDGNKANQQGGVGTMVGGICSGMGGTSATRPLPPANPVTINRIRISGITVTNCFNWPISLGYINDCRVEGCTFSNSQSSPQFVFSATDSWFANNLVHDIDDGGFVFYQGNNNCGAYGNTVYNCNDGIGVYADDGTYASDNYIAIYGNVIYDIRDTGIGITTGGTSPENQTNILVANNILNRCNAAGGNGRGAIGLVGCRGVIVRGNWISGDGPNATVGNITYSIYVGDTCSNIVVDDNTISNVGSVSSNGTAIFLNKPSGCTVTNNRIFDTGAAAATGAGIGGIAGARNVFGGNVLLTPIARNLMEVYLAADSILIGQMNAQGRARFSAGLEIVSNSSQAQINANNPTVTSGPGVPTSIEPAGSIYLRTDGSQSNHVYISGGGGWASIPEMTGLYGSTDNGVTNKLAVNVEGTTYYLLATTSNA